ncbi:MAG: efflux RND transporter periplasmic adaptor subunit [Firmicutes bacterium]|nr:efflux RND transporter periplasmic adaptor subunit [Bacillota bacterium]
MRTKKWIYLIVVLVIVGSAYGYFRWQAQVKKAVVADGPISRVITVGRTDLVRTVTAAGVVVPKDDAQLFFGRAGRIKKLYVEEGQRVKEGQLIAELEATEEQLDLLAARRQYEEAKIESPPTIVKEKELTLKIMEERLERTKLVAPFSGVVAELNFGVGEWVGTSTHLLTLIDDSKLFVDATVDEVDIARIKPGQNAIVTFTALPGVEVHGRVKEVAMIPKTKSDLVLFPVKIELTDPSEAVLVGLSAEVSIITDRRSDVLAVPLEAVLDYQGKHLVSVVGVDGNPTPVPVETGISDGRQVEIVFGLSEGDRILASNFELYRRLSGPAQHGPNFRVNLPGLRR